MASCLLPKSPVSSSLCDEVPHIFIPKSHLEPREFLISSAKRLLQHNRHKADNPVAPAFVRYWTRADKVGFRVLEVCPLLTIADMDTQFTDEVMNSQNPQRAPREAHNRELATSLQRRPAACLSRLETTSPRGLRACILRVAGCATPTDSPATLASAGTLT